MSYVQTEKRVISTTFYSKIKICIIFLAGLNASDKLSLLNDLNRSYKQFKNFYNYSQ